ncbi:uncharacterized protein EI90DRAFT_3128806 [Cantharellus anzutake]|uniref:uncharacterized protein n=1 Tax=Cantharellus anzutake TaxID=1750568 RepID=UPI00190431A7|nr:uncharacterized protein EI90DRAFT_3128806 [Cantharellus anzutake]KAF8325442.1 hypothetical protein EI90DRAFT_3128806 [Cantharellus anzutake]
MPSLPQNASSNAFDSSILTLQATFSSGMTLLTTASTANNFLRATDGPFAELKELIAQHTSIKDRPQFQPLVPPDQIVKGIVQKIWGHSSIETVGDIGDILEKGLVTDDLSLEEKGEVPQEVMKRFHLHNPTEAGQTAWQTWLKLHPGIDSQEAACLHKLQQQDIDRKYPDQAEEAKVFYDKILIHCGDLVLSKDEREAQPNEGLYLLQKITGKYAAQLAALSSIHPVGVASPMIAEMVKAMGLPLTEDSALAMRNFYDGIKAFRYKVYAGKAQITYSYPSSPYQPDAIKQRTFLQHLGAFTNPDKSTSKVFGASSLMKTVVMHMKQSVHFSDDLDRYLGNGTGNTAIKSEVEGDANNVDYHTPALKRKEGLAFADETYGSHPQRRTECAGRLKAIILEATGITELGHNWRVANILSFMLEHRLRFVGWHHGVPRLNKSLLCNWTPRESARCIMQLTHQDPEQTLRVEQMTDDEYLMREVLHYVPDAKGNITKYLLPEHETRRAIARTAVVPARTQKRKDSTPNSPTVEMEGDSVGDNQISSPSSKRRKKSKATRAHTLTKAKPPRVTPGGHNQMKEAAVPENEVKGPQDDGIVPETPPRNSPEPGGSSSSSVKLEAINLTTFPSGVRSGFQQGRGPQLPDDPENDVFMEQAVPESHTPMVIPPIRLIHPTPHSTPLKVQPVLKINGSTHLTVNEGPTSQAPSEAPSSVSSLSGEPPTFDTLFRCARNSVWRAASKMLPAVRLKALMEENVELLVNIDIIALHVTEKEPPPEVLDVAQHWRMISAVGNELRDRGADVGKVARRVVQLLDELEVNDDEDVIATWIQMLPS